MEQEKLPNGTMIIVLGILGYLCCCLAGLGIIPSAIAYFMATKAEKIYAENPEGYDNAGQIKTGKIVALIAVILNVLAIINVIYSVSTTGWDNLVEQFMQGYKQGQGL